MNLHQDVKGTLKVRVETNSPPARTTFAKSESSEFAKLEKKPTVNELWDSLNVLGNGKTDADWMTIVKTCSMILTMVPDDSKEFFAANFYFRRACAQRHLKHFDESLSDAIKAKQIAQERFDFEMHSNCEKLMRQVEKEKLACDSISSNPTSPKQSETYLELRKKVWNQVEPTRISPPDIEFLNSLLNSSLGDAAVPAIIDIFCNPKEPATGIACNQGNLAFLLSQLAKNGNPEAAAFLRRIADDEINLYDSGGQEAYEIAKEFIASANPSNEAKSAPTSDDYPSQSTQSDEEPDPEVYRKVNRSQSDEEQREWASRQPNRGGNFPRYNPSQTQKKWWQFWKRGNDGNDFNI